MIQCPNCGMENAPTRAFCAVCGERLPAPEPERLSPPSSSAPAGQGESLDLDWLLAEEEPSPTQVADPAPPETTGAEPEMNWLLQSLTNEPDSPSAPSAAATPAEPTPPPPPPVNLNLPSWLQGAEVAPEPLPSQSAQEWDSDVDFSDLPEWEVAEEPTEASAPSAIPPTLAKPFSPDDPIQAAETEGTGLLSGVRGPIPIEPIITISHEVPEMPGRGEPSRNSEAANLFARIAGGAVVPEPLATPKAPPRGAEFFYLLLLLAIIVPLLVNIPFGPPPQSPAALAFAQTIERLPANRTVLLAFDYEASLSDELDPAAIATLTHLRRVAAPEGGEPKPLSLLAVSTSPQGTALAERAWAASNGPDAASWQVVPYLSGGSLALRALLQSRLNPTLSSEAEQIALIIVLGDETADVQRWLEQVGSQITDVPMLAIAPASAETTLMPYLVAGQLDGLLAGIPGTASYEFHGMRDNTGIAWRRIDALTVAALLVLVVILVGNIVAALRGHQERQSRESAPRLEKGSAASPRQERKPASERRTALASLTNRQRRK